MTIHKKPIGEKEHEIEKYKFMKEQVRPQQKKNMAKFALKTVSAVVLAVVFGTVAGTVFYFIQSMLGHDKDISEYLVETVRPEQTDKNNDLDNNTIARYNISHSDIESIDNYDNVCKEIAAIGNSYRYALVKVKGVLAETDWSDSEGDNGGIMYGAVFRITKNEYFIVTDSSVVNGTDEVTVEFYGGEEVQAGVIGVDSNVNLAVLRIVKEQVSKKTTKKVSAVAIGSTSGVSYGSNIIAAGAPNGIMYSVMLGKVTNANIDAPITDNQVSVYSTDIVSTSVSNGIILNTHGEMIGFINNHFQNLTGEKNIGFISINSVHDIIEFLVRGRNVAYLGIEGTDIDLDKANKNNLARGVYITSVYSSSPAYLGGMRVADIIEKIDGQPVKTIYALHNVLLKHRKGDDIKVEISRKIKNERKNITLNITLS